MLFQCSQIRLQQAGGFQYFVLLNSIPNYLNPPFNTKFSQKRTIIHEAFLCSRFMHRLLSGIAVKLNECSLQIAVSVRKRC